MTDVEGVEERVTRRRYLQAAGGIGIGTIGGCTAEQQEAATTDSGTRSTPPPVSRKSPTAQPTEASCPVDEPLVPASDDEWWPMYQHETRNSGWNPATIGPTDPVGIAWRLETGGEVRSSPAVVDGTLYIGSNDGHLYAIDMVTGTQEWAFETGGPVVSSPAVVDGLVYVGSMDHRVYAVDAATGEAEWIYATGGGVRSSPTVAKDLVSASTPKWRENGIVAIGSDDGAAYILDGKTGEEKFSITTDGAIVSTPWIAPYRFETGPLYLWFNVGSTDGSIYGCTPTPRGQRDDEIYDNVIRVDIGSPIHSSITVNSDPTDTGGPDIFGADDGTLRYLVEGSFHEPWTFETDGPIRSSPALDDDSERVFFGSGDGNVYAVDVDGGERLWTFETGGKVESSPAITDEAVYVGSADQHVYGLDPGTGRPLWRFRTGGAVYSSPAVVAGSVFVGSDDGAVYAFTACS